MEGVLWYPKAVSVLAYRFSAVSHRPGNAADFFFIRDLIYKNLSQPVYFYELGLFVLLEIKKSP